MAIQDINMQTNKSHAVPQNIMDVEFKIIGDLTVRQFAYLFVFEIIAYTLLTSNVGILRWPLGLFFGLFGLGLAFVPVQDRGLDVWIVNFIKSIFRPTQMVWNKDIVLPPVFLYDSVNVLKQELITLAPTSSRRKLEEYLDYTKKQVKPDPLDIPEEEYINKVRFAFSENNQKSVKTISPISQITIKQPVIVKKSETPTSPTQIDDKAELKEPMKIEDKPKNIQKIPSKVISEVITEDRNLENKIEEKITEESEKLIKVENKVDSKKEDYYTDEYNLLNKIHENNYKLPSLSSERHSGRVFTSFIPSKGELVLPIRGERILQTSNDVNKINEDIELKTKKLQKLISQIRSNDENTNPEVPKRNIKEYEKVDTKTISTLPNLNKNDIDVSDSKKTDYKINNLNESVIKDNKSVIVKYNKDYEVKKVLDEEKVHSYIRSVRNIEAILKKYSKDKDKLINVSVEYKINSSKILLDELFNNRKEILDKISFIKNSLGNEQDLEKLKNQLIELNNDYQQLKYHLNEINIHKAKYTHDVSEYNTKQVSQVLAKTAPKLNEPNIVWGFVKDLYGNTLPNAVVLIKNERMEPVRATKTNNLGQFVLTTPLDDGNYYLQVSPSSTKGLNFDTISIEANGRVIPSIELIGN